MSLCFGTRRWASEMTVGIFAFVARVEVDVVPCDVFISALGHSAEQGRKGDEESCSRVGKRFGWNWVDQQGAS